MARKSGKLLAQFNRLNVVQRAEIEELRDNRRSDAFHEILNQVEMAEEIVQLPDGEVEPLYGCRFVFAPRLGEIPAGKLYLHNGIRMAAQPAPDQPPVLGEELELTAELARLVVMALDEYNVPEMFATYQGLFACRFGRLFDSEGLRKVVIAAVQPEEAVSEAFKLMARSSIPYLNNLAIYLDGEWTPVFWRQERTYFFRPPDDFEIKGHGHAEVDEQVMLLLLSHFGGRLESTWPREAHHRVMGAAYFLARAVPELGIVASSFEILNHESSVHSWRMASAYDRLVKIGFFQDDWESDDTPHSICLTEAALQQVASLAGSDIASWFNQGIAAALDISPDLDAAVLIQAAHDDMKAREREE